MQEIIGSILGPVLDFFRKPTAKTVTIDLDQVSEFLATSLDKTFDVPHVGDTQEAIAFREGVKFVLNKAASVAGFVPGISVE